MTVTGTHVPRPARGAAPRIPSAVPRAGRAVHRRDIEGLRAVAVLLVVLYHCGVPLLGGGYVGVDVFFVISGFLITGLLIRELTATGPLYGVLERLRGLVAVEPISPTCFRYRTTDPRHMNPMILERLRDAGVAVMSLSEVPRSLESVYLQIVSDAEPEREDVLVLPRKTPVEVGL